MRREEVNEMSVEELQWHELRWSYKDYDYPFEAAEKAEPVEGTVGQERAISALSVGLSMAGRGYNVFVCGLSGTGRTSSVKEIVKHITPVHEPPKDRCYVHNFDAPDKPILLTFERGKARQFRRDMDQLIAFLQKQVPRLFEDESFTEARQRIEAELRAKEAGVLKEFEQKIEGTQFTLAQVKVGPVVLPEVFPVVEGKPIPIEQLEEAALSGAVKVEDLESLKKKYWELKRELSSVLKQTRRFGREGLQRMRELVKRSGEALVRGYIEDLKEKYADAKVSRYLEAAQRDILDNLELFRGEDESAAPPPARTATARSGAHMDPFLHYRVNVILDNTDRNEVPIVVETSPTLRNLFGTIEVSGDAGGRWQTDFMRIKAGSLLEADGGYLIVNAFDVLSRPGVWDHLKRTLKNQELRISAPELPFPFAQPGLLPEPIQLNTKVIMIGDAATYELLYGLDDDFKKVFKIKAEFDTEMPLSRENVDHFMAVLAKIRRQEGLLRFRKAALGAILEYAVRRASRRDKVSTRFGELADLMREASLLARNQGAKSVSERHVEDAILASMERHNLVESKIKEMIADGTIMIETDGAKVGQVNGLSIIQTPSYTFGRPTRITASTSAGKSGIINIEREARLSGRTYDKGVLILGGYLRLRYGQDKPLNLSASVCFEQSYSEVEGDSASSSEAYAIISSLAEVPIQQGIAVTGSVDQKGQIQPIGGINYKIEGFFDVCRAKGLTGRQGVLIPKRNVESLMLRKDVVQAVKEGKFHIYPVETIDEGLEVLTGLPAGRPDRNGNFPEGTINYLANEKLKTLVSTYKEYSAP